MSETASVTKPILDALAQVGIFALRLNSGVIRSGSRFIRLCPAGTSDILAFPVGRVVWIETKVQGNRTHKVQRDAQEAFAEQVKGLGHEYVTVRCLDDILPKLEAWRKP